MIRKNAKVFALVLAIVMMLSTAAFAAEGDHFVNGKLKYSANQVRADVSAKNHVRVAPSEFQIEVEGKLYDLADANAAYEEDKANWKEILKGEDPSEDLKVVEVSAIDANTISVTFDNEETVEIELEEALVHGQTEVTFVYEEVEYTAELTEAWVDEDVVAAELAEAKETAKAELDEYVDAAEYEVNAEALATAIAEGKEAVDAAETTEEVEVAVAAAKEAIDAIETDEEIAVREAEEALQAATEAVVKAEESLLEADLADARELVDALEDSDEKVLLGARLDSLQLKLNGIRDAVNNATTEVQLYNALNVKPFVNVDVALIKAYDTAITGPYTTIAEIQTIIDTVNATQANTAVSTLVTNAISAVLAAETDPIGLVGGPGTETKVAVAQTEIDKLPTEIPEAVATALNVNVTVKADLQERLDAVKVVVPVLEATNQIELLAALQNKAFDRVNEDLIATYESDLDGSQKTVVAIQGAIDAVNLSAATAAVGDAETAPLTAEKVATAQALVNYLAEDVAPATTKADLQDRLDVVTALIAVADAETETELLAALENEVLGLTDVNPAAIAYYKTLVDDGAVITTATNVQVNVVDAGNTAAELAQDEINARINYVQLYGSINKGSQPNKHYVGFSSDYKLNYAGGKKIVSFVYELYRGEELLATIEPTEKQLGKMNDFLGNAENEAATFTSTTTFDIYNERESGSWSQDKGWIENNPYNFPTEVKLTIEYSDGEVAKGTANLPTSGDLINMVKEELTRRLVNDAETAEDVNAALLGEPVSEYLNVPGADKLFVAEKVLDARNEVVDTKKFADYSDLTTALGEATTARTNALDGVNNLTADKSIAEVIGALEAVSAEFAEMTNAEKAQIAEDFFLGLEFNTDGTALKTPFRTLAAIKEAAGL